MMIMKYSISVVKVWSFALLGWVCAGGGVWAAPNPTEVVRQGVEEVLAVVKDKSMEPAERRRAIGRKMREVVDRHFDFRSMSQSVLAIHWQKASAYERERFVEFFAEHLEQTYLDAIESYTDEKIRYSAERIEGNRAVVDTTIRSAKAETPVSYKMKLNDGEWFVYDVVIENASLVNNYRTLYAGIIKTEGIGGLLDSLEGKIQAYKKQRNGDARPR